MSATIASGVAKQLRYKKESTLNTAPGASGAQLLRRQTSEFSLVKQTYQSAEIRPDYQISDFRHGGRSVSGQLNGELSCLSYADFIAAALRGSWATPATTGALTNVTASATGPHFVRPSGSFLTDGLKVGDVGRWSGWTTTAAANNGRNYRITALTATQMTVADLNTGTATVAAKASGDSVTFTVVGKKVQVPLTGHTNDSFFFEEWHPDINQSERFGGCRVGQLEIGFPASGMATIGAQFTGIDMTTGTSAYYTSPTAATVTGVLAAVNGKLRVGGNDIATVTQLAVTIGANLSTAQVVGSNISPDVFVGSVVVNGTFSAYFQDGILRDNFVNEDEISLFSYLTADNSNGSPFMGIYMPRIKLGQSQKADGQQGIIRSYNFQALLPTSGGAGTATDQSTIIIQDSQVP
ncbi:MAG: phage tail tube protein [Magnetospirillum sp.]|nr:phage tail tube protein [Magnetospirillum sp.]